MSLGIDSEVVFASGARCKLTQLNLGNDFHQIHKTILNNLLERINQVRFIDKNLKSLKNISLESEEQRKVRVYRNKQLFIDKFGKF